MSVWGEIPAVASCSRPTRLDGCRPHAFGRNRFSAGDADVPLVEASSVGSDHGLTSRARDALVTSAPRGRGAPIGEDGERGTQVTLLRQRQSVSPRSDEKTRELCERCCEDFFRRRPLERGAGEDVGRLDPVSGFEEEPCRPTN